MKKFLIITFLISLNNLMFSQTNLKTYDCYLEGTDINSFTKVEAPTIFQDANILFKTQTIDIGVDYIGNWPVPAQSAFNHAVKIWKYLIKSPVPITIEAEWKALGEESGPLAQTQTTSYKKNFPNVPAQDVNYPVSLAEALSETELNGSEEEIKIEVNSDMANNNKWYYGLDGNAPAEMYDLVSVILHEIAHGLGISHSFKVTNNLGSWGQRYANENEKGYMQSFDSFGVVGPFSTTIYKLTNTNTYPNPSDGLAGAIQSNNVYFDGPISKQMNLNNLPRLYAPLVFKGGSSIAHLDEDTFPAGNSNSCLSPQLGMAESIHSPGELGLALLQDLGWNINRLITVLSPEPGLAYMPGQSKTISWTDNMGGAIALELLKLDAFGEYVLYSVITSHPSPRGQTNIYNWTIPNVEGTFKIRMIDNTFSNEGFGLSYSFIISNQAQVLKPVIFPPGDNYFSPQTISITSATPGATIYYTDDGSEPSTTNGTEYTEQFTISTDKVLKAKAFKSGFPESETRTEIYVFGEQLLSPSISPESGTYLEGTHIVFSWPTDLEFYYNYTLDGSEPGDPKITGSGIQLIANPSIRTYSASQYPVRILGRTYKNGTWGPSRYVQYTFVPYVRIAQVDDEITGDNSFGRWNRWDNNQWKDYPDIRFERSAASTDWFMQAQQDYKFNTYRKYNVWSKNSGENYFINHSQIPVGPSTSSVLAHFKNTYNATIKNNLEGTLSVNSGNFYFKDPWYIDDGSDPKGNRNRGVNPLPVLMDFKTTPNITTDSDHKGVFLDQDYNDPDVPYYSVKADQTQPIDLGGSYGTRDFFFLNWSGTDVQFENANALETGVVFTDEDAVVNANLKGNLLSNSTSGISSNSQRKLVRTDDGIYHLAYVSLGQVWYTHSLTGDYYGSWSAEISFTDGSGEAKNPSLDYYGNDIILIFEYTEGGGFEKIYLIENQNSVWGLLEEITNIEQGYFGNAKPVAAYTPYGLFVCYRNSSVGGLKYRYRSLGNYNWSTESPVSDTDVNSVNPSIACKKIIDLPQEVHIAYQNGNTQVKYIHCYTDITGDWMIDLEGQTVSSGSGYSSNRYPSMSLIKWGLYNEWDPVVSWTGRRKERVEAKMSAKGSGYQYVNRTIVISERDGWNNFYITGSDVDYTYNNSTNNTNEETVIAWSSNSGADSKWMTRILSTYSQVDNLSHNGIQVQISNGSDLAEMRGAAFNTEGLPYSIDRSTTIFGGGSLAKTGETGEPTFGRTGVVYKNGMEFVFFLGDIMLADENILFVERSDTLPVAATSDLNDAMTTKSFQLNSGSELFFSVLYYVINTELADSVLTENDIVTFGVELVKADNNQVVGTFDNVLYSINNLNEYDNVDYQVDCSGIESGSYFFRLITDVGGDSELYLSNVQNDNELLAKKNYHTVKFDELLVPEQYALMQNYPNPFNPSTTIRYQIPQSGFVTLKVYDILGKEVVTLVNEEKSGGRYEVNFNASSLASGVYLYRLNVNARSTGSGQDYVDVKKLILLK